MKTVIVPGSDLFLTRPLICVYGLTLYPPPRFEYLKRNDFCPVCHTVRPSVCRYIFQNLIYFF